MATFGKTTNGASNTLHNSNRKVLSQAILSEDAILETITIRARSSNVTEAKHWKGVIYSDVAGVPSDLLVTSVEQSFQSTSVAARTANFSGQSLPAGTYWIGCVHDGNGTTAFHIYRDNTTGLAVSNTDNYADGPAATYGTVATLNGPIDAFITYSPDLGTPTAPDAPSDLTAMAISDSQIDLAWTDNATGAAQEDNFVLERKTGAGGTYTQIAMPDQDATTYADTGLTPETEYFYRIKATNTAGDSSYSSDANATTYEEGYTPRWLSTVQAWIYPGPPAENADEEYTDGRVIHTLKPEYYHVNTDGTLSQMTDPGTGENGYSISNAADVLAHCAEAFYTVSADEVAMAALTGDPTNYANAITALTDFCVEIGFHGVELDWEGFGGWTSTSYANYKLFVEDLADSLHDVGKKLIIDGPPIGNATEQGYYQWRYEDFESSGVDYIAVMSYDYQFDYGGGTAVAPNSWVIDICNWVKSKLTNHDRIIMGIPSYGYYAPTGDWPITNQTKVQVSSVTGYGGATRDPESYEMQWTNGGNFYCYQDATGLDAKRQLIEDQGITRISVWHLGGNDWFSGAKAEPHVEASEPGNAIAFFTFF